MRTALALLALAAAACGSSKESPPSPGSASGARGADAAPPARPAPEPPPAPPLTAGAFPAACAEYREMVERLSRCGDALPQATRENLKAHLERQWADWEKLPEKEKAALATICKSSSESVKAAASAACKW